MRRWQYVTDEGLILGYISIAGPLPAEELVSRLGKKRTTLLPKLYSLRDERKIEQTTGETDWRAKPYALTDRGRRDVERYHLVDAVRAYLEDSALAKPLKEDRRRLLEAAHPEVSPPVLSERSREPLVEVPASFTVRSRATKVRKKPRGNKRSK